jgi:predicted permease
LPVAEPIALDLTVDWRVLAYTAGLCVGTTMLFGLVPALQSSGLHVLPGLEEGVTTTPGRGRARLRAVLMTTQVALSTLLLIAAGVLVRSITSARGMDLGFSPAHVLAANLDLSTLSYSRERGLALYEDALTRLEQDSRVESASMIGVMPLTVSNQALGLVKEGAPAVAPGQRVPPVFFDSVALRYFQTLGIPLLSGRDFALSDDVQAPAVAIVNETLANRFWPGENPLGQRLFSLGPGNVPGAPIEVVGVARNAKYATVGEDPKMFMYRPLSQEYSQQVTLLVKTTTDPIALLPVVRGVMQELDPDVALFRAGALDRATRVSLLPLEVAGSLAGALGVVVFGLAAIGIYGMTSYLVRQRTREIGVRLALGADPAHLVRTLTREGMLWTAAGLGLGWTAALASTQLLRTFLYGVGPTDPVAFLAVPLLLGATAYAACRIPASAVIHVDPLTILRDQ